MDAQLPQIPLFVFFVTPLVFLYIILCTGLRHDLLSAHITNSVSFVSVVIGFILLYAMQKYERVDENSLLVRRHLEYLGLIALKYDPSLIRYLVNYAKAFSKNTNSYDILCFERKILPQITDNADKERVIFIVTLLDDLFDQRVSTTNTIPNLIWYIIITVIIILTVLFPLDRQFKNVLDSILIVILLWLPIAGIYYLYVTQLESIDDSIDGTIALLEDMDKNPEHFKNVNGYCRCAFKTNNECNCIYK